jgi:E3 ubiquitin-protein ligase NEDD4
MPISGKVIVHFSTNTSTPLSNPGPSQLAGSSSLSALRANASAVSLVHPDTSGLSNTPTASTSGVAATNGDGNLNANAEPSSSTANGDDQRSSTAAAPVATGTNAPRASTDRNFSATEDQYGPLPPGWERRTDHLGRTYYVRMDFCVVSRLPS